MLSKALQAAAGNAGEALFVDSVFSSYLYTGNGSTQTITNGIDLAGEGGMYWFKVRNIADFHYLTDTVRGATKWNALPSTGAEQTVTTSGLAFNNNGVSFNNNFQEMNQSGNTYASWTFRKAPKFFDVVTYTGDGVAGRTVAHNLGSVPGCIIVKCTSLSRNWIVYHRGTNGGTNPQDYLTLLNSTSAQVSSVVWNNTLPTDTNFTLDSSDVVNGSGQTYVAYLFAHDAGGFGAGGSENVISCGSFTTDGSGNFSVNLGYEPQWIIIKQTNAPESWYIYDSMRGFTVTGQPDAYLVANTSGAEQSASWVTPSSTGFASGDGVWGASNTHIYIAIRRPMKPPESGTEVFSPVATTASGNTKITTDFPLDLQIHGYRTASTPNNSKVMTRLTGVNTSPVNTTMPYLITSSTGVEALAAYTRYWDNTGFEISSGLGGGNSVYWNFRRAPGFFDVVCYTGTGSTPLTVNHNLGVPPEIVLVKRRTGGTGGWYMYAAPWGNDGSGVLNSTSAFSTGQTHWNNTNPTSTYFQIGTTSTAFNGSGSTYVAYLFATLPGISKVGSYTGTGTTLQVNCGFTSGARFVLIKRTDSTGDWYVWDTARGIVAGNDPYLLLNSTAAEVTGTDYVDTYSAGFEISSTAPAAINANGGSFVFLAIA